MNVVIPPSVGAVITDGLPNPCSGPLVHQLAADCWVMSCRKCRSEHYVTPSHHRWTVTSGTARAAGIGEVPS